MGALTSALATLYSASRLQADSQPGGKQRYIFQSAGDFTWHVRQPTHILLDQDGQALRRPISLHITVVANVATMCSRVSNIVRRSKKTVVAQERPRTWCPLAIGWGDAIVATTSTRGLVRLAASLTATTSGEPAPATTKHNEKQTDDGKSAESFYSKVRRDVNWQLFQVRIGFLRHENKANCTGECRQENEKEYYRSDDSTTYWLATVTQVSLLAVGLARRRSYHLNIEHPGLALVLRAYRQCCLIEATRAVLGPFGNLVEMNVYLTSAPRNRTPVLNPYHHTKSSSQSNRRVCLSVTQEIWCLTQNIARSLGDTVSSEPPCQACTLSGLEFVECLANRVTSSII